MNPVKGTHPVVLEIAKALGIDPARCKHFSLDFPPGGIVMASFTLYPTHEQLTAVKDLIAPVADGIEKRDKTGVNVGDRIAYRCRKFDCVACGQTHDGIPMMEAIVGDTCFGAREPYYKATCPNTNERMLFLLTTDCVKVIQKYKIGQSSPIPMELKEIARGQLVVVNDHQHDFRLEAKTGEKPTYAEAFVSAFGPQVHVFPAGMKYEPFDANNSAHVASAIAMNTRKPLVKVWGIPSDDAMHKSGLITQAAFDQHQSEQISAPPESADEPKPIHFREFL